MTKIPPWSYSTLTAYETCPLKYYASKVSKEFPEKQTEATLWGNRVHNALEHRIKDKTKLPEGMEQWEPLAEMFCGHPANTMVFTEKRYALNDKFRPTDWDSAWVRGILDVGLVKGEKAKVYDWKTGKVKPDSTQLMLFAAFVLHSHRQVNKVKTGFIWLADGSITEAKYDRDGLPAIWEEFLPRVKRWENAYANDKWEPKPSGLCGKWCPNLKCNFNGRR